MSTLSNKPAEGLAACVATATAAATALLGDGNDSCAEATVKLTTKLFAGGKLTKVIIYAATVGVSINVAEAVDAPTPPPAC